MTKILMIRGTKIVFEVGDCYYCYLQAEDRDGEPAGCAVLDFRESDDGVLDDCPLPNKVAIPFKVRFKEKMLNDVKCCTWRTKKYGEVGDIFEAFGRYFVITRVTTSPMKAVSDEYVEEGFDSAEDAEYFMHKLRPKTGYDPDYMGWHHWFEMIVE